MSSSQPSFVVSRPAAASSQGNGARSSTGGAGPSSSRQIQRAAAFAHDSEDEEQDGYGHLAGRDQLRNARPERRTGLSSISGTEPRHNGKGKGRHEYVTDFVAGRQGESSSRRQEDAKRELVIPLQNDLDWRQNRKKMLGLSSPSYQAQLGSLTSMRAPGKEGQAPPSAAARDRTVVERINDEEQVRGLVVKKREAVAMDLDGSEDGSVAEAPKDISQPDGSTLSADELARKALLEEMRMDHDGSAMVDPHRNLVIAISEEDALRSDLDHRPDAPDAAAYEAVPVEAFGAAMLRGMGWKEGMGAGRRRNGPQQAPEVQRRAALLGLGAKERPPPESTGAAASSGAKAGKEAARAARPNMRYIPVVQRERDSKTGDSSHPGSGANTPSSRDRDSDRYRDRERSPRASDSYRREHRSERDRGERVGYRDRDRERDRDRDRGHHRSNRESEAGRDFSRKSYSSAEKGRDREQSRSSHERRPRERDYGRHGEEDRLDRDSDSRRRER